MRRYLDYDYETVIMTARGCPSRCTFCSTTIAGRTARWNTPEHVVDEMETIAEMGFSSSIFFGDDTFPETHAAPSRSATRSPAAA